MYNGRVVVAPCAIVLTAGRTAYVAAMAAEDGHSMGFYWWLPRNEIHGHVFLRKLYYNYIAKTILVVTMIC